MGITSLFEYDLDQSLDVRHVVKKNITQELTYATPFNRRRAAYLVQPEGVGPFAAVLFVHWYEPEVITSHRRQFLEEAQALAQQNVVSLLIETMWSDADWFIKRTQADDIENSVQQVIELRIAIDFLLAQPGVDPTRFAYVGHDFGAMYGVLMGSIDPRPTCYVLMAGTPRFADWYLYYPGLEGERRQAYINEMIAFDPITHIGNLAPTPLLFQFGTNDFHVPEARAREFYDKAKDPKQIHFYEAGHGLSSDATEDRLGWLRQQLNK